MSKKNKHTPLSRVVATTLSASAVVAPETTEADSAVTAAPVSHIFIFKTKQLHVMSHHDQWLFSVSDLLECSGRKRGGVAYKTKTLRKKYGDDAVLDLKIQGENKVRQWVGMNLLDECNISKTGKLFNAGFTDWLQDKVIPFLTASKELESTLAVSLLSDIPEWDGKGDVIELLFNKSQSIPLDPEAKTQLAQLAKRLRPHYSAVPDEVFYLDILPLHFTIMQQRLVNSVRKSQMAMANLEVKSDNEVWNELKSELFACCDIATPEEEEVKSDNQGHEEAQEEAKNDA